MSVQSTLMARKKDGKRIGFLKKNGQPLEQMLSPLKCALLSVPADKGFALPGMIKILQKWNLFQHTKSKKHYHNYKFLKDVLHNPVHQTLRALRKFKCGEFQADSLDHISHLQTLPKARQDSWNIFQLMELQELLPGNQLLIVKVICVIFSLWARRSPTAPALFWKILFFPLLLLNDLY